MFCGLMNMINIDICVVTETWFKEGKSEGDMRSTMNKNKYQWFSRERKKQKARSGEGGVGILVKKKLGETKLVKISKEYEMMWIEIHNGSEKLYISAVYINPAGSPRVVDSTQQLAELEADVLEFSKKREVIVMGDFNARIGILESSIIKKGERRVFPRESVDWKVEGIARERGRQLVESMNACNMIILNGIDTKSKFTCQNRYRGESIIDYIIVSWKNSPLSFLDY